MSKRAFFRPLRLKRGTTRHFAQQRIELVSHLVTQEGHPDTGGQPLVRFHFQAVIERLCTGTRYKAHFASQIAGAAGQRQRNQPAVGGQFNPAFGVET